MSGGKQAGTKQAGQSSGAAQNKDPPKGRQNPSAMEWVVGIVSATIIVAILCFLIVEAWHGGNSPPQIAIVADASTAMAQGGYVTPFTAVNAGDTSAGNVRIEASLFAGNEVVETSSAILQWVPARGKQRGGLFFSRDPRQYRLAMRATGYQHP